MIASSGPGSLIVLGWIITVGAAVLGLRAWRKWWIVADTPTSHCAAVFIGRNEVVGQVKQCQPLVSPLTGEPCVWFQWNLEEYIHSGDSSEWRSREKRSTAAPFWIVDDSGAVLVRPRDADIDDLPTKHYAANELPPTATWRSLHLSAFEAEDEYERSVSATALGMGTWGSNHNPDQPIGSFGGKWRVSHQVLPAEQTVYLLGDAQLRSDAAALEFRKGDDPLYITTKSQAQVVRSNQWGTFFGLLVGLVGLFVMPIATTASASTGRRPLQVATVVGAGLAAIYVISLVLAWLLRQQARQAEVKERAASAWSMIDVALRRRHDLIPQLVAVTKGYADYEAKAQAAIAELRTAGPLGTSEHLPSDATVEHASELNATERQGTRSMLALAEGYPDLKADTVFQKLQAEIIHTENNVAYARAFYNEAVQVLRDRRGQFPGVLFAWTVKVPSFQLFAADEADHAVPPATLGLAVPPPTAS